MAVLTIYRDSQKRGAPVITAFRIGDERFNVDQVAKELGISRHSVMRRIRDAAHGRRQLDQIMTVNNHRKGRFQRGAKTDFFYQRGNTSFRLSWLVERTGQSREHLMTKARKWERAEITTSALLSEYRYFE